MKRKQIHKKIETLKGKIEALRAEIVRLEQLDLVTSDKDQRFVEQLEDVMVSKRPKKVEKKLIGRVYWEEIFVDEDTGKYIGVERNRVVKVDGEFV